MHLLHRARDVSRLRRTLEQILSWEDIRLVAWLSSTYCSPYRYRLIGAAICLFVSSSSMAGLIWQIKPILDGLMQGGDPTLVWRIPLSVMGLVTINGVALYLQGVLNDSAMQRVIEALQIDLFKRAIHADLATIDAHTAAESSRSSSARSGRSFPGSPARSSSSRATSRCASCSSRSCSSATGSLRSLSSSRFRCWESGCERSTTASAARWNAP